MSSSTSNSDSPPRLVSTLPDDPDFAPIIADFVAQLQRKVALLEEAAATNDFAALAAWGHWLKGTGPTLGFAPLGRAAAELEEAARNRRPADYLGLVAAIRALAEIIEIPPVPPGTPAQ